LTQIPDWCHVYKSNSPSPTRTLIAALDSTSKIYNTSKTSTNRKRRRNQIRKLAKQRIQLKDCKIPTIVSSNIKQLTTEFIKKTIVICDGGTHLPTINNKYIGEYFILSISRGDLWVHDTTNPLLGLCMLLPSVNYPVFIRLPREQSLLSMNSGSSICQAMNSCAETQHQSLQKGGSKQVFTDGDSKYYCVGAQPGRNKRGVQSGLYKLKYGFLNSDWYTILNLLQHGEHMFDMYSPTNVIRHIVEARKRIPFVTMEPSPFSSSKQCARYYNGVGFGVNVYLRCHVDDDFTMSLVQVHMDQLYQMNDPIFCYF